MKLIQKFALQHVLRQLHAIEDLLRNYFVQYYITMNGPKKSECEIEKMLFG